MRNPSPPPELPAAGGEIQAMAPASAAASSSTGGSGSFTALLGLPNSQAIELLLPGAAPAPAPTFPSDPHLVDRAARFSAFASPSPSPSPTPPPPASAAKRKADPASKGKVAKKGKTTAGGEEKDSGEDEKPAYVHVRARRGQATDSHSLAERARREKINARMELLKELVPGCSKVSGTALVLEEIINHVQSLQRQVEYLSMRLAAVNPRVDFGGLDNFLTTECGRITGLNCKSGMDLEQVSWPDMGVHGARNLAQLQQQFWHGDLAHPHQAASQWEKRGDVQPPVFSNTSSSLFGYDLASSGAIAVFVRWICSLWHRRTQLVGVDGPKSINAVSRNHGAPVFPFGLGCIRPVDADLVPLALLTTRTTVKGPPFCMLSITCLGDPLSCNAGLPATTTLTPVPLPLALDRGCFYCNL